MEEVQVYSQVFKIFIEFKLNSLDIFFSKQGLEFLGENLKIRFPDHQHGIGQSTVTVLKKKT